MAEALTKVVNGKRVRLTAEEKSKIEAEWAANDAAPKPDPFDQALSGNPMIVSLIEEISSRVGMTDTQLKDAIKIRWQAKQS